MKKWLVVLMAVCLIAPAFSAEQAEKEGKKEKGHPDSSAWQELFKPDLSNAIDSKKVWSCADGVFTASEDQALWSDKDYENFAIDLEFKTAEGTNSGVIVYCSNMDNWIPNSVEIQIADDFAKQWAESPKTWQCAAVFGHLAPEKSLVKKPGEWNRMTIRCKGQKISVMLNGETVTKMDMKKWTSAKTNPDGSPIPEWLSTPFAELPTKGRIGLQGKHAGAPIFFRNIKIKELKDEPKDESKDEKKAEKKAEKAEKKKEEKPAEKK